MQNAGEAEYYFDDAMARYRLAGIAALWMGTPFVAHANIRGAGVDCVHLCAQLYIESGALKIFDPPKYTLDGGKHLEQSLVLEWVEKSGRFERVDGRPSFGDLLCFLTAKVDHHVAIKLGGSVIVHAIEDYGVVEGNIEDTTYAKTLRRIYRPLSWGLDGARPSGT